ncbi:MAG: hypothetical protein ACREU0_09670 [Burkholderiales bacterium]
MTRLLKAVPLLTGLLIAPALLAGTEQDYMALRAGVASQDADHQADTQSAAAMAQFATPAGRLNNGSFESGDFTGWTAVDNGVLGLTPWSVCPEFSCGWFGNNDPIHGSFDAVNGFDGAAGYEATLEQSFIVEADQAELIFRYRIQYDSLGIPSSKERVMTAALFDTSSNFLRNLRVQRINLNGQRYTDLGWKRVRADLSSFVGQTVVLQIRLMVPETFTGPAMIEFDKFKPRNLQVGGLVTGIARGRVTCTNLSTLQVVNFPLPADGQWSCNEFGLTGAPGDRVLQTIDGLSR